jgi:hypothetical protein
VCVFLFVHLVLNVDRVMGVMRLLMCQIYPVRGFVASWIGALIDWTLALSSDWGFTDYVLVTGRKPLDAR